MHPYVFLPLRLALKLLTLLPLLDSVGEQDTLVREEPADLTVVGVGEDLLVKVLGPVRRQVAREGAREIVLHPGRNHVLIS